MSEVAAEPHKIKHEWKHREEMDRILCIGYVAFNKDMLNENYIIL